MTGAFSNKLSSFINKAYRKIFHVEISSEVEKFIKNLSYVGIGSIISAVFSFSFSILAGRLLGPSEYGTFTLIQSVAMFLYIPMVLGFNTAMVKYNSEKIDFFRQRSIISTTYILVLLFTIISISVYFVFSKELITIFSISEDIFYLAILFATLFVFYSLTTETLRSLHMIQAYSRLMPTYSIILLISFLALVIVLKEESFLSPFYSILIAYGVTGGIIIAFLRRYLKPEFSREWAHKLHGYSVYSLMGGISSILYLNIDKIFINIYMPISNVGVYWAYNYSFTAVITLLSSVFVAVFFPVASMCSDKKILYKHINKIVMFVIIFGWPLALCTGWFFLLLYWGDYPFDLPLTILFATAGICISVDRLYGQLLNSVGVKGVKITSLGAIILASINIILNFIFIPQIGISGAVIATIIGYLSSICVMLLKWKKLMSLCSSSEVRIC